MDITNIPQNLIKGLEQKNTEQLIALSRVLNLILGKTIIATVTATTPVTPDERAALLKQTTEALAQINKLPSGNSLTPNVKAEISRLMQQQQLIQSPELKWVNLLVNNRAVITYSDRALSVGQSLSVQLKTPQKLVIVDDAEIETLDDPATQLTTDQKPTIALNTLAKSLLASANTNALNITGKTTPNNSLPITTTLENSNAPEQPAVNNATTAPKNDKLFQQKQPENLITNQKSLIQIEKNIAAYTTKSAVDLLSPSDSKKNGAAPTPSYKAVTESLRQLLPHNDVPDRLINLISQLQQLPATTRAMVLPLSVESALKNIAAQIRTSTELSDPNTLTRTLKNSGNFLESQLAKPFLPSSTPHETNGAIGNKPSVIFQQDLKGATLNLVHRINQELTNNAKPLSNEQTAKLVQQFSSTPATSITGTPSAFNKPSELPQDIMAFLQQLMSKPIKELSNKELRSQLLILLQQHAVHSLAKIQLQQLHNIAPETSKQESSQQNSAVQIDIPIKHLHNEQLSVNHLHVRIEQEWINEKGEGENSQAQKIKQWSVTLRFDLPSLGEFSAQLTIVNNRVSATLWADQELTFTKAYKQLEQLRGQLESEGILVRHLQCIHGVLQPKPLSLSYSLIDIST